MICRPRSRHHSAYKTSHSRRTPTRAHAPCSAGYPISCGRSHTVCRDPASNRRQTGASTCARPHMVSQPSALLPRLPRLPCPSHRREQIARRVDDVEAERRVFNSWRSSSPHCPPIGSDRFSQRAQLGAGSAHRATSFRGDWGSSSSAYAIVRPRLVAYASSRVAPALVSHRGNINKCVHRSITAKSYASHVS